MTAEQYEEHEARLSKYYAGIFYGQAVSSTIYVLATLLERVDNDLLG
jgi:cell division control protein 45